MSLRCIGLGPGEGLGSYVWRLVLRMLFGLEDAPNYLDAQHCQQVMAIRKLELVLIMNGTVTGTTASGSMQ